MAPPDRLPSEQQSKMVTNPHQTARTLRGREGTTQRGGSRTLRGREASGGQAGCALPTPAQPGPTSTGPSPLPRPRPSRPKLERSPTWTSAAGARGRGRPSLRRARVPGRRGLGTLCGQRLRDATPQSLPSPRNSFSPQPGGTQEHTVGDMYSSPRLVNSQTAATSRVTGVLLAQLMRSR